MKRGAEKTLRIGGVLWVGLVVLLGFCWLFIGGGGLGRMHEGFLRVQQKGLEGDQQATCQFRYFLDAPQTFFASWSFSTCCVLPPSHDLCNILVILLLPVKYGIVVILPRTVAHTVRQFT